MAKVTPLIIQAQGFALDRLAYIRLRFAGIETYLNLDFEGKSEPIEKIDYEAKKAEFDEAFSTKTLGDYVAQSQVGLGTSDEHQPWNTSPGTTSPLEELTK